MPYDPSQPRDPAGSATGGQWSEGSAAPAKPVSPFWQETYPGKVQVSADLEMAAIEKIAHDTSLPRDVRTQAFRDREAIDAAARGRFRDGKNIRSEMQRLIAGGCDRLEIKGPRAYLRNADGSQRWELHSKVERDYVAYRLSKRYQAGK